VRVRVLSPIFHDHSETAGRQARWLSPLKLADGLGLPGPEHRVRFPGQLHRAERLTGALRLHDVLAERGGESLVALGRSREDLLSHSSGVGADRPGGAYAGDPASPMISSELTCPSADRANHHKPDRRSGAVNRLLRPDSVRHMSVTTATQGRTATHHDTQRDKSKTARAPGYAQATGRFRWWWQVLGSNQRRLSRRFYRPLPLATRATCLAPPASTASEE
jgi:hypothetical protein